MFRWTAAHRLTLSKQLNKLKRTGGDHCTQPLKLKVHATKNAESSVRTTNARDQKWRQQ